MELLSLAVPRSRWQGTAHTAGAEGSGGPSLPPCSPNRRASPCFSFEGRGRGGEWEVKAALLDAVCLGCPGPACLDASLLVWMRCTDPGLCASLQEKEKKPLKEGVQDMLVKHHLFSWDIDG